MYPEKWPHLLLHVYRICKKQNKVEIYIFITVNKVSVGLFLCWEKNIIAGSQIND